MRDIETREDIERLLNEFYVLATKDELIGHHFAELDLETHIPVITDFWDKILFGNPVYFGNPLFVHYKLNQKSGLAPKHFERWTHLFYGTVDRLFAGETADLAKSRAEVVAGSLSMRLNEDAGPYTNIETDKKEADTK